MTAGGKSPARFWIWLPLVLYGLLASACPVLAARGVEPESVLSILVPLGSFLVFFYAFYLALWKTKWTVAKRMAIAAALTPAPLVLLAILDFAGVQLQQAHDPHVLLFNISLWFEPGYTLANPVRSAMERRRPPEPFDPAKAHVRGAIQQPGGSLLVYGGVESQRSPLGEKFQVFARLDDAGNVDTGFHPPPLPSPDMTDALTESDGTVLLCYDVYRKFRPVVVRLFADGSWQEIFRVAGWEGLDGDNPQSQLKFKPGSPGPPVQLLPRCAAPRRNLVRLLPDHRPDAAFNAQAAKVLAEQNLRDYCMAAFDRQGRLVVALERGLLRLDSSGQLLPPGAIAFDRIQGEMAGGCTTLAVHSNGSIFAAQGEEQTGPNPLPRLMRFDQDLREDRSFTRAASGMANGVGRFHVLGMRADGGVIVSLVQKNHGSRILYLGPQGQLLREVHLDRTAGF